jgi:hypothetical protein
VAQPPRTTPSGRRLLRRAGPGLRPARLDRKALTACRLRGSIARPSRRSSRSIRNRGLLSCAACRRRPSAAPAAGPTVRVLDGVDARTRSRRPTCWSAVRERGLYRRHRSLSGRSRQDAQPQARAHHAIEGRRVPQRGEGRTARRANAPRGASGPADRAPEEASHRWAPSKRLPRRDS